MRMGHVAAIRKDGRRIDVTVKLNRKTAGCVHTAIGQQIGGWTSESTQNNRPLNSAGLPPCRSKGKEALEAKQHQQQQQCAGDLVVFRLLLVHSVKLELIVAVIVALWQPGMPTARLV